MQIIWQIGFFPVNLQLTKLPMGFLTTLDHIAHNIYAKRTKNQYDNIPLSLAKKSQPIPGTYRPKRCAVAAF